MATSVAVRTLPIPREELKKFLPNPRLIKAFENIAYDVSNTLPDAIGQLVQGPSGGVADRHVVIFDGTSGYIVKDGGIAIDDLAPLLSPHFTGVPTAPTPAGGDNSTKIATTAFVAAATTGSVTGPGISGNNNIVLFNGITGQVIKDSGVQLAALAPLASPAFTGNPTAPNQALGDNDTSIANTAFVQDAITNLSASAASFSAHNNGVAQSMPNNVNTLVNMSTEVFDVGSKFASNAWTPPAGRLVMMSGAVTMNLSATSLTSVAIFKNGSIYKSGVGVNTTGAASPTVMVTCIDIPNGTDVYDLRLFHNAGSAQNTIGTASLTWFQGTTIQS